MPKEDKNIKNQIEQQFKELMDRTETDPLLRREVFGTLAKIEGAATIIDLFTSKMVQTESIILENLGNKLEDRNPSKK